jgi:PEP-CTERM motif
MECFGARLLRRLAQQAMPRANQHSREQHMVKVFKVLKALKALISGIAATTMALFFQPAQAAVVLPPPVFSTFNFSGNCEDCAIAAELPTYAVTGTLVMQNYAPGNAFNNQTNNFVSFTYSGSNLYPAYTIYPLPPNYFSLNNYAFGVIAASGLGASDFHVADSNSFFNLSSEPQTSGRWDTGRPTLAICACFFRVVLPPVYVFELTHADMGGSGSFSPSALNSVPEPATLLLMGAALAAAGVARRRRH